MQTPISLLCLISIVLVPSPALLAQLPGPFDDSAVVLRRWVPQVADGGGWKTEIRILNRRTRDVNVVVRFFKSGGTPWIITTIDSSGTTRMADSLTVRLSARGLTRLETSDATSNTEQGFAYIEQQSSGDVDAFYTFRQRVPGRIDSEGSGLADYSYYKKLWGLLDTSGGFATGLALVNPSPRAQQYILRVLDTAGNQTHAFPLNLQPAEHMAFSVAERYPDLANRTGTIVVDNVSIGLPGMWPNSIAAVCIRFHPTGSYSATPMVAFPD